MTVSTPAEQVFHPHTAAHFVVLVVDDHRMMRLGLQALAQTSETHVGARQWSWLEAGCLDEALTGYRAHAAVDLVLLDLNLPDSQGLKGLWRFLSEFPAARVAVFSATDDEFVVRQALALGAVGFVPKSAAPHVNLGLIESLLHQGDSSLSANNPVAPAAAPKSLADTLSPTQLRVLELVLAGMSNQQVASECHLAIGTVKNAVSSIMLLLDVDSRSHLISVFK